MAVKGYWDRVTASRLNRRRALGGAATLGAGAAALSLVGCGGGDGDSDSGGDGGQSGLVGEPRDTTSQAKAGGIFKDFLSADTTTMDPIASTSFTAKAYVAAFTYPQLVKFKVAKHPDRADGSVEGDAMESIEISGDKLQITMKLRPGMKWDPRAPTSGREIDIQDVVQSLERYREINPFRGDIFYHNETAPSSPVDTIQAPDARTLVLKLKIPDASLLPNMANYATAYVLPKEAFNGGFDPKGEVRGYGPWLLDEYRPSQHFVWRKNPDYYVKGRPFSDKIERPIVTEYAQRLAQFRAGNIWTSVVVAEDVFTTKRDLPNTDLRQGETHASGATSIAFGYGGNSPWKDQRLRQALNYLLDRETLTDVLGNRLEYQKEGVEAEVRMHSIVGAAWDGYWVDPTDEKKFGSNAKFFHHNVAEAKKLMSAAGFANGVESTFYYNGSTNYGAAYTRLAETLIGMFNEGGMKLKQGPTEYQNDWLPNYHFAYTNSYHPAGQTKTFDGLALKAPTFYATATQTLFTNQHKDGSRFEGCTPNGQNPNNGDPELNSKIDRLRGEFDIDKAQDIALEIAQFVADKAYFIQGRPYSILGFGLYWPVIGNLGVYRTWPTSRIVPETALHWWIDDSKPPLKTS
jgi:ABC-type transport system substrate-binding protein